MSADKLKMNTKPSKIASKIPTSGRDSGTHSRSSSVSNLTTASDIHSEIGDAISENAEGFKIDERVWVNGSKSGCIKFIGKTQFAPGVWAGVLLDEPVGKNNGTVAGVKYFTCEPLQGIFSRPNKLTRTPGAISTNTSLVEFTTPKSSAAIPSSRSSVCSNISSSGTRQISKLRVGERVTVSSLGGLKPGTLKFVGETDFAKGEWAGIELDEPTGKNDGSVAGKRYFTCPMKFGLFSPLHKVSRVAATPVSRPGSVRGTSLVRSSSRDSLSSSISNSSRVSRVKLGITSLSNAQKTKISGGGITTASKALQEALKEKEQHIEQLLKERDLDRAEFARATCHFKEIEAKSSSLEKQQKKTETDRKNLEEKLVAVQKKLEDIQFQLEEEKILKSDFEVVQTVETMQLQERKKIFSRIEDFISQEPGEKFVNIKEIISGQGILSESSSKQDSYSVEIAELKNEIALFESRLKQLSEDKQELLNQLTELQQSSGDSFKNENIILTLNTTVQEKDEMITHLKVELNSNIEKVTQLIEDNKNLSELILQKEQQAKGHADDVIKELGEKVNTLKEEIKTKSSELNELITSVHEKDNKISELEQSLNDQSAILTKLQNELDSINNVLKDKDARLEEKIAAEKYLEESILVLKSEVKSDNDEKQKKINLFEEEVKKKSSQINEYVTSIQEKENFITSLQKNFDNQAAILLQLQNLQIEFDEKMKKKDLELEDATSKHKFLKEQINVIQSQNESNKCESEKKIFDFVKEIEHLTNCLQEKEDQLVKLQNEVCASQTNIEKLNENIKKLTEKLQHSDLNSSAANKVASGQIEVLKNELSILKQEKDEMKVGYQKDLEEFNNGMKTKEKELQSKNDLNLQHESQISILNQKLLKNEDECSALKKEVSTLSERYTIICKEKESIENNLKEKEELAAKEGENWKALLDKSNYDLAEKEKKLLSIQDSINLKEERNDQLISKLQLAEQKVEMLNKDSSDHVMTLQNELSKIKEESTASKTRLEQELAKVKGESEKLFDKVSENDKLLEEKVEALTCLEKKLKEKETELSSLTCVKQDLMQNIANISTNVEAEKKKYQEILSNTQSEYAENLALKEQELTAIICDRDKLVLFKEEQEQDLLKKEEMLRSLQEKLKDCEIENSDLTTQNSELIKNIAKFSSDIEEEQKLHKEQLNNSVTEYDNILQEKEQIIQSIKDELKTHADLLESKIKELHDKESEINALKNAVNEKESQFDELAKTVELSQKQLILLKERNEKNESLLQEKESSIKDFKIEQEKQLQLKEQNFMEKTTELSAIIQNKEEEIKQNTSDIFNLMSENENHKKSNESLQVQLEIINAEKNKMVADSSSMCQQLKTQVEEMEIQYSKLLEENEKIAKSELEIKEAKKSLELVRDSLLQEKSVQEVTIKDKEDKLKALEVEVMRMQTQFTQHKQELQQKLDVSQMELEAVAELKNQLEIQHSVHEDLQEEIQTGEKRQKELEVQIQIIPIITEEKNKLQAEIAEFEKTNKENSEKISNLDIKNLNLKEQLNNNKNLILQKEKDLLSLQKQLQKLQGDKHSNSLNTSLKSLEEENNLLKNKITLLELEKKTDAPAKSVTNELSVEDAEEKASLLSQVDFLNSIIVDMKQKNEELTRQLEIQKTCWEESDINQNETKKVVAPRLFCDICDMFDVHDTEDCPKQESFLDEEVIPQLKRPGTQVLEERPYCNNCEIFGHWTLDCDEPETF